MKWVNLLAVLTKVKLPREGCRGLSCFLFIILAKWDMRYQKIYLEDMPFVPWSLVNSGLMPSRRNPKIRKWPGNQGGQSVSHGLDVDHIESIILGLYENEFCQNIIWRDNMFPTWMWSVDLPGAEGMNARSMLEDKYWGRERKLKSEMPRGGSLRTLQKIPREKQLFPKAFPKGHFLRALTPDYRWVIQEKPLWPFTSHHLPHLAKSTEAMLFHLASCGGCKGRNWPVIPFPLHNLWSKQALLLIREKIYTG